MKEKYAKQNRYNQFNEKARDTIRLIKGQTWEISKTVFKYINFN